ncbi:unnamed protein product, partial [Phaeothamnion confervicola]
PFQISGKPRFPWKLQTEIKIHRGLSHPRVVRFHRCFEDAEHVYILLELCSHCSLSDLVRKAGRCAEPDARRYMLQILDAVEYLHAHGVIHRDLKLGNVFLDAGGDVKLGDFGLAAKLERRDERKQTVCGTPNYIAPEILEGKIGHSFEVDIWSVGVILYAMLVGRPPYESRDVKSTYRRILANSYTFPNSVDVADAARDLIHRMLQTNPDRRPSLAEIRSHPFLQQPPPSPPSSLLALSLPPSLPPRTLLGQLAQAPAPATAGCCPAASGAAASATSSRTKTAFSVADDSSYHDDADFIEAGRATAAAAGTCHVVHEGAPARKPPLVSAFSTSAGAEKAGAAGRIPLAARNANAAATHPDKAAAGAAAVKTRPPWVGVMSSGSPAGGSGRFHIYADGDEKSPAMPAARGRSSGAQKPAAAAVATAALRPEGKENGSPGVAFERRRSTRLAGGSLRPASGAATTSSGAAVVEAAAGTPPRTSDRGTLRTSRAAALTASSSSSARAEAGATAAGRTTLRRRAEPAGAAPATPPATKTAGMAAAAMPAKREAASSAGSSGGRAPRAQRPRSADLIVSRRAAPARGVARSAPEAMPEGEAAVAKEEEHSPLQDGKDALEHMHDYLSRRFGSSSGGDDNASVTSAVASTAASAAAIDAGFDVRTAAAAATRDEETATLSALSGTTAMSIRASPAAPLREPTLWVTQHVEYTAKYGVGYLLCNGSAGVYFNDATKIVLEAAGNAFEYIDRVPGCGGGSGSGDGMNHYTVSRHTLQSYPPSLQKKVTLLQHFWTYLLAHEQSTAAGAAAATAGVSSVAAPTAPTPSPGAPATVSAATRLVYVKKWVCTRHAILFRLSDRTVQVVFFDSTQLLLTQEARVVTYVDRGGGRETMHLDAVFVRGRGDVAKRLRYSRDMMSQLCR